MELPKLLEKLNLPPNSYVSIGDTFESIVWTNKPEITKEFFDNKVAEIQSEYEANQYQRDRALAYPSIQDQLDMQYWDSVNNTTTWKDAVAKVKADNPKPE